MLLNPDQDNGIIIGHAADDQIKHVGEWFERFGKRLNRNLDKGGLRALSWRDHAAKPDVSAITLRMEKQISQITSKPTVQDARWANVVLDFDTLYGNDALTHRFAQTPDLGAPKKTRAA